MVCLLTLGAVLWRKKPSVLIYTRLNAGSTPVTALIQNKGVLLMNRKQLIEEINAELKPLDLPSFRKKITKTGRNVAWLLKNIARRNKVSDELITKLKMVANT